MRPVNLPFAFSNGSELTPALWVRSLQRNVSQDLEHEVLVDRLRGVTFCFLAGQWETWAFTWRHYCS